MSSLRGHYTSVEDEGALRIRAWGLDMGFWTNMDMPGAIRAAIDELEGCELDAELPPPTSDDIILYERIGDEWIVAFGLRRAQKEAT